MNPAVNLTIVPLEGIGPVKFGMTRQEVRAGIESVSGAFESSEENRDYFFGNALRVEYDDDGRAYFIAALPYPGCGCTFSLFGVDPWSLPARKLFRLLAREDGAEHRFNAQEHIFPAIMVTVMDADSQYDHLGGGSRRVYLQVGVGSSEYRALLEREAADREKTSDAQSSPTVPIYVLTIESAEADDDGVRLRPGLSPEAMLERPALGAMAEGETLELRRPDGSVIRARLVSCTLDGRVDANGLHLSPDPLRLIVQTDIPAAAIPAGTQVWYVQGSAE